MKLLFTVPGIASNAQLLQPVQRRRFTFYLLPALLLAMAVFCCGSATAQSTSQISAGFFNGHVFATWPAWGTHSSGTPSALSGNLNGNSFTATFNGTPLGNACSCGSTTNAAIYGPYTPGGMPANNGWPNNAYSADYVFLTSATTAYTEITFSSTMKQGDFLHTIDVDNGESVDISFYDAANNLVAVSGNVQPVVLSTDAAGGTVSTPNANTYRISSIASNSADAGISFKILTNNLIKKIRITQLSYAGSGASYDFTFSETAEITGTVYNDPNGLTDNLVSGTGTNLSNSLMAVLYNNTTGAVTDSAYVLSNGTYTLNAVTGNNYSIYLTSTTVTIGQAASPFITAPAGYGNSGENLGNGSGSDGTADGILNLGTVTGPMQYANFGVSAGYYDFGDVPAGYENNNAAAAVPARQVPSASLRINGIADAEAAAQSVADGADNNDTNGDGTDEDGLAAVPPAITVNSAYSITVAVTNTTGGTKVLHGWIDFNNNGIFESTERVSANVNNNATSATLTWSATNTRNLTLQHLYLRLRLSAGSLADAGGTTVDERAIADGANSGVYTTAQIGEVEDYQLTVTPIYDFGDAPVSYELNNSNAAVPARNIASAALFLGTQPDAELTASSVASGADNNGSNGDGTDEDGISSPPPPITIGSAYSIGVTVTNTSGSSRTLYGWIDLNNNGIFESGELATVNVANNTTNGNVVLSWTAAKTGAATAGKLYMRLRIAAANLTNSGATAVDERSIADGTTGGTYGTPRNGEVEDYLVTAQTTDISVLKSGPATTNTGAAVSYTIRVSNYGQGDVSNVTVSDPAVSGLTVSGITCAAGSGAGGAAACPASVSVAALQAGTLTIPTLPNGSDVTFTVTGTATGSIGSAITNTVTVALPAGSSDLITSNNSSTITTTIIDAACAGALTVYTLDKDATVAANSISANGGTVNLLYTLTSGTAVTGIGSSFTVPLQYSDLTSLSGADHQWAAFTTAGFSTGEGGVALVPNAQNLLTGSIYFGRSSNNTTNETFGSNQTDNLLTSLLSSGAIDLNGTFTTTIGTLPTATGYRIKSNTFLIQGRGNISGGTPTFNSAWYVKPIDQSSVYSGGTSSQQDPLQVEYGSTFTWKYAAFSNTTANPPAQNASRGASFYGSVTYINNLGCADLAITKSGTPTVAAGGTATYTIVVTNNGSSPADGATVSDPAVTNFTAATVSCTSTTGGAACPLVTDVTSLQNGTLTIPALPSGATVTFTVTGTAGTSGTIANTATTTTPTGINDAVSANNTSTANTSILLSISGTVFNDANGIKDNLVSGSGTNAGGLNAILVNDLNLVADVIALPSNGAYTFSATPGTYSVLISSNSATIGSAPPAVNLPATWVTVSEFVGSGAGYDATTDGILSLGNVTTSISNVNFGIERRPAGVALYYQITPVPTRGSTHALTGAYRNMLPLGYFDDEDCSSVCPSDFGVVITALTDMRGNVLSYDGTTITNANLPFIIPAYDPDKLMVTFNQSGLSAFTFHYQVIDAAGVWSTDPDYTAFWGGSVLASNPLSFEAATNNGHALLHWTTLTGSAGESFAVERSADGRQWKRLAVVQGKGNAATKQTYTYTDAAPLSCDNYYRLAWIDKAGGIAYSTTQKLQFAEGWKVALYPNPATADGMVLVQSNRPLKLLRVKAADGSTVYQSSSPETLAAGNGSYHLDINAYPAGIYLVEMITGSGNYKVLKLVKQ